jgi:hypothetical protein
MLERMWTSIEDGAEPGDETPAPASASRPRHKGEGVSVHRRRATSTDTQPRGPVAARALARVRSRVALPLLLAGLVGALQVVVAPPAAQADPASLQVQYSMPQAAGGVDCSAGNPLNCSYTNTLVGLVDALPAWSGVGTRPQAWVSFYSMNQSRLRASLLAADARGVAVHLVTWRLKTKDTGEDSDHVGKEPTGQLKVLVDGLALSNHSKATVCKGSCFSGGYAGREHAKILATYDPVGTQYRVVSGSGNSVWWSDDQSFNDWVVESSSSHYKMVADYLKRAEKDRKQKTPKPVTDKALGSTLYLMPVTNDPLLTKLKAVRYQEGCTVRVAMYQASNSRVAWRYADQLVRISKAGCFVRVIGNRAMLGATPAWPEAMIARLRLGGVTVLDGHRNAGWTMHEKRVTISAAGVTGDWIGSVNWTRPSIATNMENALWRSGSDAALEGIAHDDVLALYAQPWV